MAELRDLSQHMLDEAVRVRSRPGGVGAVFAVAIALHGRADARDQGRRRIALHLGDEFRCIAEPASVGLAMVDAQRVAPADHVEAGIGLGAGLLHHHPGMMREDATPAADPCREDVDGRLGFGRGGRQQGSARPVGPAPVGGQGLPGPPGRMSGERQQEEHAKEEEQASCHVAVGNRAEPAPRKLWSLLQDHEIEVERFRQADSLPPLAQHVREEGQIE